MVRFDLWEIKSEMTANHFICVVILTSRLRWSQWKILELDFFSTPCVPEGGEPNSFSLFIQQSITSNSLKPVVRPSVRPAVCSSVRQKHLWARRALQPSAGGRKKPSIGGLNFLVTYNLYQALRSSTCTIFGTYYFSWDWENLTGHNIKPHIE